MFGKIFSGLLGGAGTLMSGSMYNKLGTALGGSPLGILGDVFVKRMLEGDKGDEVRRRRKKAGSADDLLSSS